MAMGARRGSDGTFVIEFGYICYQDTYPMYLACIVHVFSMYLDVSRQIHQDTFQHCIQIHQSPRCMYPDVS